MSLVNDDSHRPSPRRILSGADEPIFDVLPERVLSNLRLPTSENALLWNLTYPLVQPAINLLELLELHPLWGTRILPEAGEDDLIPYYWGYRVDGERLSQLDEVLEIVDGPGPTTEVDLFLFGRHNLVLIEAKHMSGLGRCSRYTRRSCPEMHLLDDEQKAPCRYWEGIATNFEVHLEFGPRPEPGESAPVCHRHYQLARTLLVGHSLASRLERIFHMWLVIPRDRWSSFEFNWKDFTERIRDDDLWRRMRVLAWEDIRGLSAA